MLDTLSYIGDKLNCSNIAWAVGGSILLNQYGFIDKPNDIDIFIDIKDMKRADEILKSMGLRKKRQSTSTYSTKSFYEYIIEGMDVDVMAGFAINHPNGVFEYTFDHNSISEVKIINEISIPLTSLEDWYVIYQLIPNREKKVEIIEKYLLSNGIRKPILLKRALRACLPMEVRSKIENLLSSQSL